ncbi:MAG: hypothetical protein MK212_14075 [Saprospiraceae bacterium]|nr:hypothetical protein [Saprospiraceae bacterium]
MKTKIKAANLEKVNFALQRKELLRISSDMKTPEMPGGDSPETSIPFFVKKNHRFACGTEHPLVVFAAKNPAWKKQAKEAFKEDKKGMLYGNCYINGDTLLLQVQKGNMKLVDLKKAAKMLLKKAGIMNVGICQGSAAPAPAEEGSDSTDNSNTVEENQPSTLADLANLARTAVLDFKNSIVPMYKAGILAETDTPKLKDVEKNLSSFTSELSSTEKAQQAKFTKLGVSVSNVSKQLATILGGLDGSNPKVQEDMEINKLAGMAKSILKGIKRVKKKVVKNLKKNKTTDKDLDTVVDIISQISEFGGIFDQASDIVKTKLQKEDGKIKNLAAQMDSLKTKVESSAPSKSIDQEDDKNYEELLDEIEKESIKQKEHLDKIAQELKDLKAIPKDIPQGAELLAGLD